MGRRPVDGKNVDLLLEEVHGFIHLLQRHSFLRYQTDQREYNVKRMVVIDGIARALSQVTRVDLPVLYEDIPVEDIREANVASIQRLMRQTIRNMKRSLHSLESSSSSANGYGQAIPRWENALRILGEYSPHADRSSPSSRQSK